MIFGYSWIFICTLIAYSCGDINNTQTLCKNSLDFCMQNVSVFLERNNPVGIPKSKADVDIVCKGFKMGMKCFDDFSNLCLTLDEKNMVNDNVIGAKYTFKFLCDDETFQKDFLKYTDCYRVINSDWDLCTEKFMSLVREEMKGNQSEDAKVLNMCCAKHGFLNCVYTTSKMKCGMEEANFLRKIADTLSENKFVSSACQHIKLGHCNTAQQTAYSVFTIIFHIFIVIWHNKI
ncbi:uncharacterized protein LOC112600954 [Melanaphis sacchari]|uniref:uncharacterized protein LOC112600954 n=1 Tax=Melanaphis sacchari TaxID=742174 RepID=UPI000DC145D5|nr:uncharacterized protein LOC112600954 [Melanaphis sacchari]